MKSSLLLIDDEPIILNGLKSAVNWKAYGIDEILLAGDGRTALDMARNGNIKLIITDIMMPEMDGLEFLHQLRTFNWETRVIILSGYDLFAYAQSAIRYGASEYLLKPVSNEELEEAVSHVLNQEIPKPKAIKETLNRECIRDMYFGRQDNHAGYPPMPPCAFICAIKLKRNDSLPGYIASWLPAIQSGILPNRTIVFDEDSSSVLLFCPIPSREMYYEEVERTYDKIILALGLDENSVIMLAGSPCSTPDEVHRTHQQFEVIERVCKKTRGIIYAYDDSALSDMRIEIRNAILYIRYNYAQNITLNDLAEIVQLSPNYLSQTFKQECGENISAFLTRTRIERAAIMLRAGQKYVYQAAAEVGYHDVVYFSKLFFKIMNCTPQQYIRKSGADL